MLKLSILGIRGIPAQYGGFETFAERLSKYLVS
ncbi:MAG: glycosyltransferase family 1 protein, partial [Moorea sp. SIO4G2]|nr:glycosyltransferase family 1 protein [Moorena sp. SIO4G2]